MNKKKNIISVFIIIFGLIIISLTFINTYIILLLALLSIILLQINKKGEIYKVLPIIPIIILLIIIFNYFVIEPRVNFKTYLENKYNLSKDKMKIRNIDFTCESSSLFTIIEPCISVDIYYEPYEIYVIKTKKYLDDNVSYGNIPIELEIDEDYAKENNIDINISPKQQLKRDIVEVFEKNNVEYKRYNYDKFDPNEYGDYYYLVKTNDIEKIKVLVSDIKKKIKIFYENISFSNGSYSVNIAFIKSEEIYEKYEEIMSQKYTLDYTEILIREKNTTFNNNDFYQIDDEFINEYQKSNNDQNYDFIRYDVAIIGNAQNGMDSIINDSYEIKGVKVVK